MNGSRKLTDNEIALLLSKFTNIRDYCLILTGLYTGFRISELISLKVSDIIGDHIRVTASRMKGKTTTRTVALHPTLKSKLNQLIKQYNLQHDSYLFQSRNGINQHIKRAQAHNILKSAINILGLQGKVSSHSLRKTLAHKVYAASNKDIIAVQKALGHKSLTSTQHYLSITEEEVDNIILSL